MKAFLLFSALLFGYSAQAQVLPVPGDKNPDWVLLKTEKRQVDEQPVLPPATDRMPNAIGKSIISKGNHHFTWDAERQLAYDWFSQDASTMTPLKTVTVREQRSEIAYIYRRAK